jgi:hypothetical protein
MARLTLRHLACQGLKAFASCSRIFYHKHIGPLAKLAVYRTFVRPTMEYGLQVIKPLKGCMQKLEKIQNKVLRACLSLPGNASTSALLGVTCFPTMSTRASCLSLRYLVSLKKKDESFLAHHVSESKTLRYLTRLAEDCPTLFSASNLAARRRKEMLMPILLQLWTDSREGIVAQRIVKNSWRPDVILNITDPRTRYTLLGWRFCLSFGEPGPCAGCPEPRCSWKHAILCSGVLNEARRFFGVDSDDPLSDGLNKLQSDCSLLEPLLNFIRVTLSRKR